MLVYQRVTKRSEHLLNQPWRWHTTFKFLNFIIPKGWSCWNAAWNPGVSGKKNPAENSKVFQGMYIEMMF